ncbi:hypothetical protein LPJ53_003912, partial [Coemansia erecta]
MTIPPNPPPSTPKADPEAQKRKLANMSTDATPTGVRVPNYQNSAQKPKRQRPAQKDTE